MGMEPEGEVHGLMPAPDRQGIILKASACISVFQTESHYVAPVLNLWSSCLYVWDYRYVKAPSHKTLCLLACAVNGSMCILWLRSMLLLLLGPRDGSYGSYGITADSERSKRCEEPENALLFSAELSACSPVCVFRRFPSLR